MCCPEKDSSRPTPHHEYAYEKNEIFFAEIETTEKKKGKAKKQKKTHL